MKKIWLAVAMILIVGSGLLSGCGFNSNGKGILQKESGLAEESAIQEEKTEKEEESVLLPTMEVHFIDVGQGDATLIKCEDAAMLIDAGDDTKGTMLQNYLQKQGIGRLDYFILTHPDSDHIGGAPVILTKFDVKRVFLSNFEKENRTYQKLMQALEDKQLISETPAVGNNYSLGSAFFSIVAPNKEYEKPNNASIALVVQNGEKRFLFTGDAEEEAEQDILQNGMDIRADVYQVGHHGSKTSSSGTFLDKVNPQYAVVSCGEENPYGHPHAQTLNAFRSRKIDLFRTDEQGSVIAVTDGSQIQWNCTPSDTWRAGESIENSKKVQTEAISSVSETVVEVPQNTTTQSYVLNVETKKFHRVSCNSLPMKNRQDTNDSKKEIMAQGYTPCKRCNP